MRIPITQMSNEVLLRQLLDAIPSFIFLVDRDVCILEDIGGIAALQRLLPPPPN